MVRTRFGKLQILMYCFLLVPLLFLLAGCYLIKVEDANYPCGEKISAPQIYEDVIRSNPVIQQLNLQAKVGKIDVSPCFNDNRVSVLLVYEMPANFSSFGITYSDRLSLIYSKDGTLELNQGTPDGTAQIKSFEPEAILERSLQRIKEIESNPRIKEVIIETEPDPLNPVIPLFGMLISRNHNHIEYNFFNGTIKGYLLSNRISWQEFPEINQTYKIIEDHFLTGTLANCQISRDDRGYISASSLDMKGVPWAMTVLINCKDSWKDVFVRVHDDGTYDSLMVMQEYKK
jgi:hypothetical protein